MKDYVARYILPAVYPLLPPAMHSQRASAFLIAIGLQESGFRARRQHHNGPAKGLLQFEEAGIRGVLMHQRSTQHAERLCQRLCYGGITPAIPSMIHDAVEHNDVLCFGLGRLLLWTLTSPLPGPDDHELAWEQYFSAWRPGRPVPASWEGNYLAGWRTIRDLLLPPTS